MTEPLPVQTSVKLSLLGRRNQPAGRHSAPEASLVSQTSTAPGAPPSLKPSADVAALLARIRELESALAATKEGSGTIVELSDQRILQDVGIYRYHHPLEDAAAYKDRLHALDARVDEVVKSGCIARATTCGSFSRVRMRFLEWGGYSAVGEAAVIARCC
jgi:hypothetical protein